MTIQELNNRQYVHGDICLQSAVVDNLKKWNRKHSTVHHDVKFIKVLLIDVFTTERLSQSTIDNLDLDKMRFIRGMYQCCQI